ncbi:MAG: hypothetical protein AAF646_04005 [Pseudomonadota bacterium]
MRYEPSIQLQRASAIRADLQARADMLAAAEREFMRDAHHMGRLEASFARWLLEFRAAFGNRFCVNALLSLLPLPEAASSDPAEARLRQRHTLSHALRPAVFRAIAKRRDALACVAATDTQIASRTHTEAYTLAFAPDFTGQVDEAAQRALASLLAEPQATDAAATPARDARLPSPAQI